MRPIIARPAPIAKPRRSHDTAVVDSMGTHQTRQGTSRGSECGSQRFAGRIDHAAYRAGEDQTGRGAPTGPTRPLIGNCGASERMRPLAVLPPPNTRGHGVLPYVGVRSIVMQTSLIPAATAGGYNAILTASHTAICPMHLAACRGKTGVPPDRAAHGNSPARRPPASRRARWRRPAPPRCPAP